MNGMSINVTWTRTVACGFTGRHDHLRHRTRLRPPRPAAARIGALMAIGSMLLRAARAGGLGGLIDQIGAEGAAWLRLVWAGAILLLLVRPRRRDFTRSGLAASRARSAS